MVLIDFLNIFRNILESLILVFKSLIRTTLFYTSQMPNTIMKHIKSMFTKWKTENLKYGEILLHPKFERFKFHFWCFFIIFSIKRIKRLSLNIDRYKII